MYRTPSANVTGLVALLAAALACVSCASAPPREPDPASAAARGVEPGVRLLGLDVQRHIRSGRHVDLAVDGDGAAYLASFLRPGVDDEMQMLVRRLEPDGTPAWTLGPGILGRATSLALAPDGDLWVTGFVEGLFPWETAREPPRRDRPFLLRLDREGDVLATRLGRPGLVPELVRVAPDGSLLVVGRGRGDMAWDDARLHLAGLMDEHLLAGFDAEGRCLWMRALEGRTGVSQAAATPEGDWVLGGDFVEDLAFNGESLETEGPMDAEGFVLRTGPSGETRWLRRLGRPGHARPGERSREMVRDLFVTPSGEIRAVALLDDEGGGERLAWLRFGERGSPVVLTELDLDLRPPGGLALAGRSDGGAWLAYKRAVGDARYLGLVSLDPGGRVLERHEEPAPVNTMIRAAALSEGRLWLAGHFQDSVVWRGRRLVNAGDHQLFVTLLRGDS